MTYRQLLSSFLLLHSRAAGGDGVNQPVDGAPLYAYRCTDSFYQKLRVRLADDVRTFLQSSAPHGFCELFCIYAAETFRREHVGGVWAWHTVFSPLDVDVPPYHAIAAWVDYGLNYWQRQVITGTNGQRMRLTTIACEGGLPLRLLQNQGGALRQFFSVLLQRHPAHGAYSGKPSHAGCREALYDLAREHIHTLPQTLRNEEVVRLAVGLVGRVVDLQRLIGVDAEPLQALDAAQPNWRSTMPLRLDDTVAQALFRNLIEESQSVATAATARPGWQRWLRQLADGRLEVESVLRFSAQIAPEQLSEWMGKEDLSGVVRLRLLLTTPRRQEAVAVLTHLLQRAGADPVYRREWLRGDGVVVRGKSVLEPHALVLHDGRRQWPLALEGDEPSGSAWGYSPWVFVPSADARQWRWFGEGSVRTRQQQALVVVPASCRAHSLADALCERVGELADLERVVFRIVGGVEFLTPEGERYVISSLAASDSVDTPQLWGDALSGLLDQRPVYLGCPRLSVNAGIQGGAHNMITEWRRVGVGSAWRRDLTGCAGKVWVRLVAPETGVERVRRMVDVVPPTTRIEREVGGQGQIGRLLVSGAGLRGVRVVDCAGVTVSGGLDGAPFAVNCQPLAGSALSPLTLEVLVGDDGAPVPLRLPRPQRGAAFLLDARTCDADETVALDRLHGLWLLIQNPGGTERYFLRTERIDQGQHLQQLGTQTSLPALQAGALRLNMGLFTDAIGHLLGSTADGDASVRLTVCSVGELELARIRVTHHDMTIEPVRETGRVQVPLDQLHKLGDAWTTRLTLQLLPLWSPLETPIELALTGNVVPQWRIPDGLPAGPWWVMGADGDWKRFRPLLWQVTDATANAVDSDDRLAAAVREANLQRRAERMDLVLARMAVAPDDPDWELLQAYVSLAMEYPPTALDPLRHLIRHPATLAMALLKADDERFERLISFADQMPFAWSLLPVESWKQAAVAYFRHLGLALAAVDGCEALCWSRFKAFRQRAMGARPWFEALCDWLQEQAFPEREFSGNVLTLVRAQGIDFVIPRVDELIAELQARHHPDEYWPVANAALRLADSGLLADAFRFPQLISAYRATRCAPFVAAAVALGRVNDPPSGLVYELKVVRGFDIEWFDQAYALGLTLGLADGN